MIKNGGYTMLDLATATYKDAAAAFNANKPVMVYDGSQVYYADSIILDGTNVVLTKGGKTITIDSSNNVTSSGKIQPTYHRYRIGITDSSNSSYNTYAFLKDLPYETNKVLDIDADMFEYLTSNIFDNSNIYVDYNATTVLVVNDYNSDDLEIEFVNYDGSNDNTVTITKVYFAIAD